MSERCDERTGLPVTSQEFRESTPRPASEREWAQITVGSRWRNKWTGRETTIRRIAPEPNLDGEMRIYEDADPVAVGNGWHSGWWLRCWEPA